MDTPILRSRKALKNWFYNNDMVKWTLYATHYNEAKNRVAFQTDEAFDIDKSWNRLDESLKDYDYMGDFYLFVTKSKDGTGGGFQTRLSLSGIDSNGATGGGAINGLSMAGMVSMEQVQGLIEGAMLRKENEELKQRIAQGLKPESGGRFWDLIDRAIEDEGGGKEMVSGLVEGFKEIGTGVKYALMNISAKGGEGVKQLPPAKPKKQGEKPQNTEGGKKYKVDKMFGVFSQTEEIFPDAEPQEVHAALIEFFSTLGEVEQDFMKKRLTKFMNGQNTDEGNE